MTASVRTLNLLVPFSSHRDRRVRVCDTYDWYAPRFQHHHTEDEVVDWFRTHGFQDIRRLRGHVSRRGIYDWFRTHDLIPGSGVNAVGRCPL